MIKCKHLAAFLFSMIFLANAQESGQQFERWNILNKNQVRTVFSNMGVVGHPVDRGPRGAWLDDNNGYLGDVSPFVGCEIPYRVSADSIFYFHSMTYCLADRRPNPQERSPSDEFWGFLPQSGYFNESKSGPGVAVFTDPSTWPTSWPDRLEDAQDPGWPGQWNGFFGKGVTNATEETYFAMDDDKDIEFNFSDFNTIPVPGQGNTSVEFKPDSTDLARGGMGLDVKVRALQWKQFLAQDVIFWLYEITNVGTTDYEKATFGMLVGTYVGVTGGNDNSNEWDDDWSFFDAELDVTYTGDYPDNNQRNPLWDGPVGMVGYAFLESPGNPFDGIDNDNDADENGVFTNAPFFTENSFDTMTIAQNDQVVLIDNQFNRSLMTITEPMTVVSQGREYEIIPGETQLVEGNVLIDEDGFEFVNPNAVDGIDNDLDGIIDENFFLHYFQRRQDPETGEILISILRPLRYVDYFSEQGIDDLMLDESRSDGIDNNNDWDEEFDDVGLDGLAESGDIGEGDGMPTSGYDDNGNDTGLPGEPHVDKTDVRESDQIGLTSFDYFLNSDPDINDILQNDEKWWERVSPGRFDVPTSIQNNQPLQGEDGDFFYASGYFPLLAGQTERFSIALVYGGGRGGRSRDLEDLLNNLKTVQKIYDSNYQFPKEPDLPTLNAEVGDGQVILSWDRKSESSFDPVLREFDFEGYKLYKSNDPDFSDVFTVTDANGKVRTYEPLQQWDLANGIRGIFNGSADLVNETDGLLFDLGEDTGLKHYYVDNEVENGRTYYYALTAYDRGKQEEDIFPSESPFLVTVLPTGEVITGQNTARVIPGTNVAGYVPPPGSGGLDHIEGPSDGRVFYQVVDEKATTGHTYLVDFYDSSNDGIDNDGDWIQSEHDLNNNGEPDSFEPNVDKNDLDEFWPKTTSYSVRDLTVFNEEIYISDTTSFVKLAYENIDPASVEVQSAMGSVISESGYVLDAGRGRIKPNSKDPDEQMMAGETYTVKYQYFPVFRSDKVGEIVEDESQTLFDTDIFDGVQLSFINYPKIELIDTLSGWNEDNLFEFLFSTENIKISSQLTLIGKRTPNNYVVEFSDATADTCLDTLGVPHLPVNFSIRNETLNKDVDFVFAPGGLVLNPAGYYELNPFDRILFFEEGPGDKLYYTWQLLVVGDSVQVGEGHRLTLSTTKAFRRGDELTFTTIKPTINTQLAETEMENIRVVPNPYVVAHDHESPLPPTITSGRGERKITFTNLPQESMIKIFTARGEHVVTIEPDLAGMFNGTATWNLKNKENLDIAFGVYFYVVEAPVGTKKGKIAIIK